MVGSVQTVVLLADGARMIKNANGQAEELTACYTDVDALDLEGTAPSMAVQVNFEGRFSDAQRTLFDRILGTG